MNNEELQNDINTNEIETEELNNQQFEENNDGLQTKEEEASANQEVANAEEPALDSEQSELYSIKANGKEYDFTLDELKMLASKGVDYTKKTTAIKPYRAMISTITDNNLSQDDLNLLIDLKKGNKDAIVKLINDNNIDPYDLPSEVSYTPNNYAKNEMEINFNETVDSIKGDIEFSKTSSVYQSLDDQSKEWLYKTPQALQGLHNDIKSGLYDKVMPYAEKMAMLDSNSKPMLEYYILAGQEVVKNMQSQQPPKPTPPPADKSRVGVPTTGRANANFVKNIVDAENDDEGYKEWLAKVVQRTY